MPDSEPPSSKWLLIEERLSETKVTIGGFLAVWIIFVIGFAVGFLFGVLV